MASYRKLYAAQTQPDGMMVGLSAAEKLAFHGATPVVQPASAAQAAVSAGALNSGDAGTDTVIGEIRTLANRLRLDLVTLGLIKGAA